MATKCQCPEQHLATRQNSCLHSLCESCCADISHFVAAEAQVGEGGVPLVIFHTGDSACQRASGWKHACCHTLLQERTRSSYQGNELTPASAHASAQVAARVLPHTTAACETGQNRCDETFLSCFCLFKKTSRLRLRWKPR